MSAEGDGERHMQKGIGHRMGLSRRGEANRRPPTRTRAFQLSSCGTEYWRGGARSLPTARIRQLTNVLLLPNLFFPDF
jgi:hypothetical protein